MRVNRKLTVLVLMVAMLSISLFATVGSSSISATWSRWGASPSW